MLTAKQVQNANGRKLGDGGGLWLIKGSWTLRYTSPATGKVRDMGLGSVDHVSLAVAREMAAAARELVAKRIDPIEARKAEKIAAKAAAAPVVTFEAYATQWITAHQAGWKNEHHRNDWPSSLRMYAYPIFGDRPIADVDKADVLAALRPIWTAKPETASRVRGRIETILDAAKAEELRSGENPAVWRGNLKSLLPSKRKVRKVVSHPALPYDEGPAFWKSLIADPSPAAQLLQFIILTVARYNEAAFSVSTEIKKDVWEIPAIRMKMEKIHRVPLVDPALKLIAGRQGLLFPSPMTGGPLSDVALSNVIKRHTGTPATTHGMRSTFRDWVGDCTDFPRELAEAALAHKVGDDTENAYRRGDALVKRRALMEAWANYLAGATPCHMDN